MKSTDSYTQPAICPTCGKTFPPQTRYCTADGSQLMVQMPDPLIGTLLPRHYRITARLGSGAMSVVYRGVYEPLGQNVAIKLLKSHLVADLQTFKRFQQEAKTAGALDHLNIASIFDFGVTDQGVPYLIMELVHGESLWFRLQQAQPLSMESALSIFIQTADALAYTHERGVIHRDVKPSNILVVMDDTGAEMAKLLDFGIAKMQNYEGNPAANLTQTGEVFGTPLYVSPEQAMGRPLDARADIYSLGCVMYEVLAGRPPFQGESAFDVLRLQIQQEPTALAALRDTMTMPPSLVAAIAKAMQKDPNGRQQSMAELLDELQRAQVEQLVMHESLSDNRRHKQDLTPVIGMKVISRDQLPPQPAFSAAPQDSRLVDRLSPGPVPALSSLQHRLPTSLLEESPPQGGPAPVLKLIIASLAGIACGIGILLFAHGNGASAPALSTERPSSAAPTAEGGLQEQERPQPDLEMLDPEIAAMRKAALALYDQGDYEHAEEQIAKAIQEAHLKDEPLGEGLLNADLCMVDLAKPDLDRAYQAGDQAVRFLGDSKDVSNKDVSYALRGLGIASARRKDLPGAEALLKRSLDLDKVTYGPNDENYAVSLTRFGQVLEARNKFDEAEKNYRQAMAVSERSHQKGDPYLATRMKALANFLRRHHRSSEAEALDRKANQVDKGT